MPHLKKIMKGLPSDLLAAEGLLYQDLTAVTPCQRECTSRLAMTIQMEQEAYLNQHPEVIALCKLFIGNVNKTLVARNVIKHAARYFTRPTDELDKEIREFLDLPPSGPYIKDNKPTNYYKDENLELDLMKIAGKHYSLPAMKILTPETGTSDTLSSSFLSIVTSDTTVPTPEPVPPPEPTLSEIIYDMISNVVDKAIFMKVNDLILRYDFAYVELMKAVEEAMEVPVIEIRQDIAELLFNAYKTFEVIIMMKEREAAAIAWEKRMRKKLKKALRRQNNFRGYETPPTPKSKASSHPSYRDPPPVPCVCHPQFHYNRYAKDRFGIYLPRDQAFSKKNITLTPTCSIESITEGGTNDKGAEDAKSLKSNMTRITYKSSVVD